MIYVGTFYATLPEGLQLVLSRIDADTREEAIAKAVKIAAEKNIQGVDVDTLEEWRKSLDELEKKRT